jgi:aspartyl-tRNA(Asn)/glutamyl-tRNA(Gln) amidotransferase subunit B
LNEHNLSIEYSPIKPELLSLLLKRIQDGTISNNGAKQLFEKLWNNSDQGIDTLIESEGLKQVSDSGLIETMIDEVLKNNKSMVDEYQSGKEKAFNALVGQIMKASKGKANPNQVNELLRKKLS